MKPTPSLPSPLTINVFQPKNIPLNTSIWLVEKHTSIHQTLKFSIKTNTTNPPHPFVSAVSPDFFQTQLPGRSWTCVRNAFVLPTKSHPRWVLSLRFDASKWVVPGKSLGVRGVGATHWWGLRFLSQFFTLSTLRFPCGSCVSRFHRYGRSYRSW